jgi:hypothetical protein
MSKGDENQEKDSQKVESAVKGDIKQSRKDVAQSNKKVFKADGQNDE